MNSHLPGVTKPYEGIGWESERSTLFAWHVINSPPKGLSTNIIFIVIISGAHLIAARVRSTTQGCASSPCADRSADPIWRSHITVSLNRGAYELCRLIHEGNKFKWFCDDTWLPNVQLLLRTLGSLVDWILELLLFDQVAAMAKRLHESGGRWRSSLMLFVLFFTCLASYLTFSPFFRKISSSPTVNTRTMGYATKETLDDVKGECCRGLEHTEFWSEAVNWGNDFLLNSSQMCCNACKKNNKCNSWVYCGDEVKCGTMYRQVHTQHIHSLISSFPSSNVDSSKTHQDSKTHQGFYITFSISGKMNGPYVIFFPNNSSLLPHTSWICEINILWVRKCIWGSQVQLQLWWWLLSREELTILIM